MLILYSFLGVLDPRVHEQTETSADLCCYIFTACLTSVVNFAAIFAVIIQGTHPLRLQPHSIPAFASRRHVWCRNEEVRSVCKGSRCLIQFLFRSSNICSGKCRTTAAVMTKASSTDDAPPSAPPPRRPRPKPPSAGAVLAQGDRDFRKPPVAVVKCQTLGVAVKLERDKNCLARETAYADDR